MSNTTFLKLFVIFVIAIVLATAFLTIFRSSNRWNARYDEHNRQHEEFCVLAMRLDPAFVCGDAKLRAPTR